jgi:hypothetical protein
VVDKSPLAVDLDHGEPLPVARLEVGIAGDVDLAVAHAFAVEDRACALAQVAAAGGVEDDVANQG